MRGILALRESLAKLDGVRQRWLALYVAGVGLLALATHIATPIGAMDSDLWYHLAHGRFLSTEGSPPSTSYFSFLEPARTWIDYFWLFQGVVYLAHQTLGFGGLLALRSILYLLLLATLAAYVLRFGKAGQGIWLGLVYGLIVAHTFGRFANLRPHCFSYLLLATFLLLLEGRSRWVWMLPPLALLWVNLHGVVFVVMFLVCGAYSLEILLAWRRNGVLTTEERRTLTAACLAAAATVVNPAGLRLLMVPFESLYFTSALISELRPREWGSFLTFSLDADYALSSMTAANLVLLCAVLALVDGAVGARRDPDHPSRWPLGRLRLSHALLCVGALILVPRAMRFSYEMTLLVLPLLVDQGPPWPHPARLGKRRCTAAGTILASLLLLAPMSYLVARWPGTAQDYPLSSKALPHGTVSFLAAQTDGGTIMNGPNQGGYLEWMLYPRHRIFADMAIPFLFPDRDAYDILSAFGSGPSLARFLERYQPDFIAVESTTSQFPPLIAAHPQYRLVFFDDVYLLYADASRHAELVTRFELTAVDPIRLANERLTTLSGAQRSAMRAELERMEAIDPRMATVGKALAILDNVDGDFDRALARLDRILTKEPDLETLYVVRGDALRGKGDLPGAIHSYRQALRRAKEVTQRPPIQRSLASTLSQAGMDGEAFEIFEQAVLARPFEAPAEEYYQLATYAAQVGALDLARRYLDRAALKTASAESDLARQIEAARRQIDAASH